MMTIKRASQRLLRDTCGTVLILFAVALSMLIGIVGLGVEAGLWFAIKRHNQTAADIAAISGALELDAGQGYGLSASAIYPDICALAKSDATTNGFTFASFTCPTTSPGCTNPASGQMCANNPPKLSGSPNLNNPNAVEVILNQQQSALLASLLLPNVQIATRAVAVIKKFDQSCLLALGTTGTDVYMQGAAGVKICLDPSGNCTSPGNCSIAANSSGASAVDISTGNPTLTADTIVTPGGINGLNDTNLSLTSSAMTGSAPVVDPYASTLTHTALQAGMPTTCTPQPSGNAVYTADVRFCGSSPKFIALDIKNQTIDFQPPASGHLTVWLTDGDLVIDANGVLECTTCSINNKGITIIFTESTGGIVGGVSMQSNGAIDSLNAPNTGSFPGVLIAQDPAGPFTNPSSTGTNCKNFPRRVARFTETPEAHSLALSTFRARAWIFKEIRLLEATLACCSWSSRWR